MSKDPPMSDDPRSGPAAREPTGGRCPICKAPAEQKFRPFCSGTCADLDLLRWLRGGYVIAPASPEDDEDGEPTVAVPNEPKRGEPEH